MKVSVAQFLTMMKLLLLCVIVSSAASFNIQNCSGGNCNQNNFGATGYFPSPYQFFPVGGGNVQNCQNSNCNQNNGRKKRDTVTYSYENDYATGCRIKYRNVCTSPVCNGDICIGRKKREITVKKGAAKSRVKRACWSEEVSAVC